MHAPTGSGLSRCRCDEAWKSRPSLLVGMAPSSQAIRSQIPPSCPWLGLGASGTGRGLTTLTESTPSHFHAASQLLRRGRCAVARDAPQAPTLATLPVRVGPEDGSTTCRRSCAPLLSWPSRHPGLLRLPGQGWAIAAPLQLFAPRQNATTLQLLVIFDLDRPAAQETPPPTGTLAAGRASGITHQDIPCRFGVKRLRSQRRRCGVTTRLLRCRECGS
jgi:hypothetical protein